MEKMYLILFHFLFLISPAQNLEKIALEITAEGTALYRSEMASWYYTDVFLANYKQRENVGGYFSYVEDHVPKCIFFDKTEKVIGTISFPTSYKIEEAKLDLKIREFTDLEREYFEIRQKALERINSDALFTAFPDTSFNIVPLINKKEKKVYVLTGTNTANTIIFGNDYLISFNKKEEISKVEKLHNSLLKQSIKDEKFEKTVGGVHSHIVKDWPFITATDICTLMLNQKFTDWENYTVINEKYTSIWDGKKNKLVILKTEIYKKIATDKLKD